MADFPKHQPGERWAVLGRNGSRKLEFARSMVAGFQVAEASFALEDQLLEREIREDDGEAMDCIDPGRTVRELIEEVRASDFEEVEKLIRDLEIESIVDRGLRLLSTGERRRTMLARALVQESEVLLFEEPFDGLDAEFRERLHRLLSGRNFILVTNRMSDLDDAITHLAVIEDGLAVISGNREEVAKSEVFQQLEKVAKSPDQLPPKIELKIPPGPLVGLKNVTVIHGGREIISGLDWSIQPGENWMISGPNGCGKSTLVNLISGDHPQCYSNDVTVLGMRRGTGESIWQIKDRLGIVSPAIHQQHRVSATVLAVAVSGFYDSVGLYQEPTAAEVEVAKSWVEIVGLQGLEKQPFRSLNFASQRLALIARALVKQPPLLILDEPCQGLDPPNRSLVLSVIDRVVETGLTQLLYITHQRDDQLDCLTGELRSLGDGTWEKI